MKRDDGFEAMQVGINATISVHRRIRISLPQLLTLIGGSILLGILIRNHGSNTIDFYPSPKVPAPSKNATIVVQTRQRGNSSLRKIAWLMSFPNSGTSFTSKMIRHISRVSTATNYGHEATRDEIGGSISIYPPSSHLVDGPFWVNPQENPDFVHPTKWVLTKTHCGCRCEYCGPDQWTETPHSFLVECLSGKNVMYQNPENGIDQWKPTRYDMSLVGKAVHLVRNPFNNIVSRFHLEQHKYRKRNDTERLEKFPLNRRGFRAFCQDLDERFEDQESTSRYIDQDVWQDVQNVPCRADFFRFIQWHNLAFVITSDMKIPTLVLHYEDYETKFQETMDRLVEFMEYPSRGDAVVFVKGKDYANEYFTHDERRNLTAAMQKLALSDTFEALARYF